MNAPVNSPFKAPAMKFDFSPISAARWTSFNDEFETRDLGFGKASGGQIGAVNFRPKRAGTVNTWPGLGKELFRLLFVLSGELAIEVDGKTVTLRKWDTVQKPVLSRATKLHVSADLEVMDFCTPALGSQLRPDQIDATLRFDAAAPAASADLITYEKPENYKAGMGPRSFMRYRDLGTAATTGGRMHLHIVRVVDPPPTGGTDWHHHSMSQFFYVISGNGDISVNTPKSIPIVTGDAMSIGTGMPHNVSFLSQDYAVIELCLPADYDTVNVPAPYMSNSY